MRSNTITTGNINSNRTPGAVTLSMKNGPKTSIVTINKNATIEP